MDLYFMSPPHPTWSIVGKANFRSKKAEAVDPLRARREWLSVAQGIEVASLARAHRRLLVDA